MADQKRCRLHSRLATAIVALIIGLSGCSYVDPVQSQGGAYRLLLNPPESVSKLLPGRTLYIYEHPDSASFHGGANLVNAFVATGLFSEVELIKDPNPPTGDSYMLERQCWNNRHSPGVMGLLALFTAFIIPIDFVENNVRCDIAFKYNDFTYTNLYSESQRYYVREFERGWTVIPFIGRGEKARNYNPVAVANDTVNHVLWGLK